jgi:glycosyltransferase involved in cell wall biosynthesis|tara:strand:- start:285 stop:1412 length:1128 start_codon:yes stop_codon:yes gene_type:complete
MKILHISNDFLNSRVHSNLYKQIDNYGFEQVIFCPLRNKNKIDINILRFDNSNSKIIYSRVISNFHRIFFKKKINFLYSDLIKNINPDEIDLQHATTLFSDGAIAYKLFLKYNIPYVVTVRNTDVNLFLNLRPDLYLIAKRILVNASNIIFISISLRKLFFENFYFKKIENELLNKIKDIPNGIDDFWLKNITPPRKENKLRFLFIGKFDKNKNVINLIKALNFLRENHDDIKLDLIGGSGSNHKKILKVINKNSWITYHGKINDKQKIKNIFKQNDFFLMPSKFETFGLVYIEALSQGLPILYTKNQGVDGLFNPAVGLATKANKNKNIANNIEKMILNSNEYKENITNLNFNEFSWKSIFENYYLKLYQKLKK